jgi:hypothetical protein
VARERTNEELGEHLDKMQSELQRLADRFDTAPFVRADVHNEQIKGITKELESVSRLLTWILGLLGSVVVALLVAVITAVARGGLG